MSDARRWYALATISVAQLMVALDATIMNIALPSAQDALGATDANRSWVITAYTLALAGLLLLGGRIADLLGQKRAFLVGLAGFAAASALGGAAGNFWLLVAGRALQGVFAAVLIPTALSLLAITFTEPKQRARAFAVYGAIASGGGAIGLLLGGVLTEYWSWRWCLYVNVVIAVLAAVVGLAVLPSAQVGRRPRFDVPGVLLVTAGLVSLVYACSEAATVGWGSPTVLMLLLVAAILLMLFGRWSARAKDPLLPPRILWHRSRIGTCIASGFAVIGMFGMFLLLTYYFQVVLGYSPVRAGLAFLPMTVAIALSAFFVASPLMPRVAPRWLIVPGLVVAAGGLLVLSMLRVDSGYWSVTLPAEILLGAGLGCVVTPGFSVATTGVDRRDAGVASAMVNTAQQVGGSLGTALLNTIAAGATLSFVGGHKAGLVHGYTVATTWAAGILLVAAVAAAVLIDLPSPAAKEPALAA
jgi:EmrB/QacA subfamily drug resistance transporter